ncbi:MAG: thermonuclease family protein [Chloroflexota bacterium]
MRQVVNKRKSAWKGMVMRARFLSLFAALLITAMLLFLSACTFGFDPNGSSLPIGGSNGSTSGNVPAGEDATVNYVVDGDTIDVSMNGQSYRVRYVGMNTPERDEPCYDAAKQANVLLVDGKTIRMVTDTSEADIYGRLLRYIYADGVFVNAALVQQGYAEVVSYPPDDAEFDYFKGLEIEATNANRGCHPTGIFKDGSYTR